MEKKCHCEFKYGFDEKGGILCKTNGTFEKALLCGSNSFCTGPSNEQEAAFGTSEMCTQGPGKIIRKIKLFLFIYVS